MLCAYFIRVLLEKKILSYLHSLSLIPLMRSVLHEAVIRHGYLTYKISLDVQKYCYYFIKSAIKSLIRV